MTNPPKQDSQASIAGEPALVQNNKNYPPIGHRGHENISDNVEKQAEKSLKKPRKIMAVIQVLSILVALGMSGYAVLVSDTTESKNSSNLDGNEILVRTEGRTADHICSEGGADIFIGNDENRNGILEESEVTSTTRICHGKEGLSGPQGAPGPNGVSGQNSMINTTEIESGNFTCIFGGLLIQSGIDENSDGILDSVETQSEQLLCNGQIGVNGLNGSQGASALVEKRIPPPYLCQDGVIIEFGIDDGRGQGYANDGSLQLDEFRDSLKICTQPLSQGPVSDFTVGITNGLSNSCSSMSWLETSSTLISAGSNGATGCELWTSMAVLDSTSQLVDINPTGDSTPGLWLDMTQIQTDNGAIVFFDADDGTNGRELWASDGTVAGTQRITSFGGAGDGLTGNSKIVKWMGGVVFTNVNEDFIWSNGTTTVELFDAPFFTSTTQSTLDTQTSDLSAYPLTKLWPESDGLWFSASTTSQDFEMHYLSQEGAFKSWDLNTLEGSMPDSFLSVSGHNIVIAEDGFNGRQLVRLNDDGSHVWLTSLTLQSNGAASTSVGEKMGLNSIGDVVLFDAQTSGVDTTLWSYNLTTGISQELSSNILAPGENSGAVMLDGKLWFDCVTTITATELCYSDGTVEGSKLAYEFQPGISSSDIRAISHVNQTLLIIVDGEVNGVDSGHCLWSFDTANMEARIAYDPWIGSGNNSQSGTYGSLVVSAEIIFMVANNGVTGHEIHSWSPSSIGNEWLILD